MAPGRAAAAGVAGVILAGGRGARIGGADKGWVAFQGKALILQVLERLRPQVDEVIISANRSLARYRALGFPVIEDARTGIADGAPRVDGRSIAGANDTSARGSMDGAADGPVDGSFDVPFDGAFDVPVYAAVDAAGDVPFDGPLAGMLAALRGITRPWAAVVPCDAPALPHDLVARLLAAGAPAQQAAFAVCGGRPQPVFCLLPLQALPALAQAVHAGERRPGEFLRAIGARPVVFDDVAAFANINTREPTAGAVPAANDAHADNG